MCIHRLQKEIKIKKTEREFHFQNGEFAQAIGVENGGYNRVYIVAEKYKCSVA